MNAILRRNVRISATRNATPEKSGVNLFSASLGEGFGSAFAIGVMLGALWLLVAGYA